eukprot:12684965-Prorocentrum_lima.AAC.1
MGMLQENFGLLPCFLPEGVGVFILEKLSPFSVPTTSPHKMHSENVKAGWADRLLVCLLRQHTEPQIVRPEG